MMRVFLSWSGERSQRVARALIEALGPLFRDTASFVMSDESVDPGVRWGEALSQHLDGCDMGILCVTAENATSPWLLFEAGALSKRVEQQARVIPYCFDTPVQDLPAPLAQFQAVPASPEGTKRLISKLNTIFGANVGDKMLTWACNDLANALKEVPAVPPPVDATVSDLLPLTQYAEMRYRGSDERIRRCKPGETVRFLAVTGFGLFARKPRAGEIQLCVKALRDGIRFKGVVMDPNSEQAFERMNVETPGVQKEKAFLTIDAAGLRSWLSGGYRDTPWELKPEQVKHLELRYTSSVLTFGMVLFDDVAFVEPLHFGKVPNQAHLCGFSVIRAPAGSRDYVAAESYFEYLFRNGAELNPVGNG